MKFVTFYLPGDRPGQPGGNTSVPMVYVPGVGLVPAGAYGIGSINSIGNDQTGSVPTYMG